MADIKVEVTGLGKSYGRAIPALADVSLEVERGQFVVLLGPSGCGKTTLLRCIAGLEQPDSGEIAIDGKPVFSAQRRLYEPPERRKLSMVFQSYALWPHMRVAENITYALKNRGISTSEAESRMKDVLALVGLEAYGQVYPGQLSGGQQQRVALARAVAGKPDLILFDEPLSNLDAKVRDHLRIELLALQRDLGFAAIYVTHDQVEAMALADKVVVMNQGRVAQSGAPADLYHNPTSRFVAAFLGNPNELRGIAGSDGRVSTPLGDMAVVGSVPAGAAAVVLIRPEQCGLVPAGQTGPNRFPVTLMRSLFLGTHFDHVVEAGGSPMIVRAAAPVGEAGASLLLQVDQAFAFSVDDAS